jgi:hypothetical protein
VLGRTQCRDEEKKKKKKKKKDNDYRRDKAAQLLDRRNRERPEVGNLLLERMAGNTKVVGTMVSAFFFLSPNEFRTTE